MKTCTLCHQLKSLDSFYKHKKMPDGHINQCKVCRNSYIKQWSSENGAKRKLIANKSRRKNYDPVRASVAFKTWYETTAKSGDGYAKMAMRARLHEANAKRATPGWSDQNLMAAFYSLARSRTNSTGIQWTVDHIVPLNSALVCGLHTEANMKLMTKSENSGKRNRHWPDMPTGSN